VQSIRDRLYFNCSSGAYELFRQAQQPSSAARWSACLPLPDGRRGQAGQRRRVGCGEVLGPLQEEFVGSLGSNDSTSLNKSGTSLLAVFHTSSLRIGYSRFGEKDLGRAQNLPAKQPIPATF